MTQFGQGEVAHVHGLGQWTALTGRDERIPPHKLPCHLQTHLQTREMMTTDRWQSLALLVPAQSALHDYRTKLRSVKSQLQSKLSSQTAIACDRAAYLVIEACGVVLRVDRDAAKGEAPHSGREPLGDNRWALTKVLQSLGSSHGLLGPQGMIQLSLLS